MQNVFKFSIISLLLTTTINFPSKAEFGKNSKSKVTVIELDDDDNFRTLNTIQSKLLKLIKKPPLDLTQALTVHLGKNQVILHNQIHCAFFGTYGFPHTTSLVQSKTKPLNTNSQHAITSSKPYNGVGKVIAISGNTGLLCSGALIGKGVVSASAHCISDYGDKFYGGLDLDRVIFIPAATSNSSSNNYGGPIGVWQGAKLHIPKCWTKGKCPDSGNVPNENDIAISLRKKENSCSERSTLF